MLSRLQGRDLADRMAGKAGQMGDAREEIKTGAEKEQKMRSKWTTGRQGWMRAGCLLLAAALLAVGVEWLIQRTLPPIFVDAEVDISQDPTLISRGTVYLHASGRMAMVEEWHLPRLAAIFLLQLGVLTLLFPLGMGKKISIWVRRTAAGLKQIFLKEKKRNLSLTVSFAAISFLVFFVGKAWIWDVYHRSNWMTEGVCAWAGIGAGCLVTFRRTLARKPENIFLLLTLIVGGLFAWYLPDATTISLDDGQHFQQAVNYSTLGRVRFTAADWDAMQHDNQPNYDLGRWEDHLASQDAKNENGAVYVTSGFHLTLKEYWMSTYGLGLFLGRVLHLRYWDLWSLGRFAGLTAYALAGFFAIRRLKSGRMVLAMSLMLPSAVFLAANYSYDPGVTVGITLSCAYWIAQWQEREQKLKTKDAAVMILGMAAACYVKAIYFPICFLFFFLPESKFRNAGHRRMYRAVLAVSIAAVILYILLPLGKSGGQADPRAEGTVNTFGQIQFILQHPVQYLEYFWHFLRDYLDPNRMGALVNGFGYQGVGACTSLILMILAVTAFTDASEEKLLPPAGARGIGQVVLFGTLVLMSTAMYAWFSEVGSPDFRGMQPRYLIPLIYPAMAMLGSNRNRNRLNPALYHGMLFALIAFASVAGLLQVCVARYY